MALNAELRIRKATETVMDMFHDAYDEYIGYLVKERDAALRQVSEAKAEVERAKEETLRLKQETECLKEEMQWWKREAEETKRQLASIGARMSLTIVPLGDPAPHNDGPISYLNLGHNLPDESPKSKRQRRMVEFRAITLEESMPTSENEICRLEPL